MSLMDLSAPSPPFTKVSMSIPGSDSLRNCPFTIMLFDLCYNETHCMLFDADFSPWADYLKAVSYTHLQYAYYKAGNSKVKNVSGSAYSWWERSPSANNATYFCRVPSGGDAGSSGAADTSYGVAFGFCV